MAIRKSNRLRFEELKVCNRAFLMTERPVAASGVSTAGGHGWGRYRQGLTMKDRDWVWVRGPGILALDRERQALRTNP